VGYVTVTLMTFDKQSNGRRIAVKSYRCYNHRISLRELEYSPAEAVSNHLIDAYGQQVLGHCWQRNLTKRPFVDISGDENA